MPPWKLYSLIRTDAAEHDGTAFAFVEADAALALAGPTQAIESANSKSRFTIRVSHALPVDRYRAPSLRQLVKNWSGSCESDEDRLALQVVAGRALAPCKEDIDHENLVVDRQ